MLKEMNIKVKNPHKNKNLVKIRQIEKSVLRENKVKSCLLKFCFHFCLDYSITECDYFFLNDEVIYFDTEKIEFLFYSKIDIYNKITFSKS